MTLEIIKAIDESIETKEKLKSEVETIAKAAELIFEALSHGNKILIFGNGGSAADAQHISGEFVASFVITRKGLPSIALTTNSSVLTAIGNDFGFEKIFSRQIEALSSKGDVIIAISTSGNSQNVIQAVEYAKKIGLKSIGFTGKDGGKLSNLTDIIIKVPSGNTQNIQESHIMIGHILVGLVESKLKKLDYFKTIS